MKRSPLQHGEQKPPSSSTISPQAGQRGGKAKSIACLNGAENGASHAFRIRALFHAAGAGTSARMSVPRIFDEHRRSLRRDRAFPRLADHGFLLDAMAEEMIERLRDVSRSFGKALVIGAFTPALVEHLRASGAEVTLLDPGAHTAATAGAIHGTEDALPFPPASFDLIVSCGTLDNVNDLPGALIALRRTLVPDGLCLLSFAGAGSLATLRAVLREAESDRPTQRIHPQVDVRALGDLLQRAGFAMPVADHQDLDVRYRSFFSLLADLRGMGGAQCLASAPPPLSRTILARAAESFSAHADADGKTRERFVILHGSGWAPSPDQPKPARRGSATASLADALKARPSE